MKDPAVAQTFIHLDTGIILSRERAAHALYPAVDPLVSTSRLMDLTYVGERHYRIAMQVKEALERQHEIRDMISMLGIEELNQDDQRTARRARRLEAFLTQPLFSTESFTGKPGRHVALEDTLAGCEAILEGKLDHVDERALSMIGAIQELGKTEQI
jgi:F-type H+-transporting ATPase subunit beta